MNIHFLWFVDVAVVCQALVGPQTKVTAPILVCSTCLLVFLMERAIDLAIIPTQFLVFFGIFFFRCFLVRDLGFLVIEVGLLAHSLLPNFLGVLADNYDSSLDPTVVSVVCGCSAYPTLFVG
jgi:hypothetical protein